MQLKKSSLKKTKQLLVTKMSAYERASLKISKVALAAGIFGMLITCLSLGFLAFQISEQIKSTRAQIEATNAQYQAIESSVYQDMMSKLLELDKLFIEKPVLYGMMYGKVSSDTDKWKPELIALTDYYLDFFQLIFSQRTRLPTLMEPNSADWKTWENSMLATFTDSRALCIKVIQNEKMYTKEFTSIAINEWCKVHKIISTQK
jgi:hypothetical protein